MTKGCLARDSQMPFFFVLTRKPMVIIIKIEKRNTATSGWPQSSIKSYRCYPTRPSLGRVAVAAFLTFYDYGNCETTDMYGKSHIHHLLSENDGQPPAAMQCSSMSFRTKKSLTKIGYLCQY